MIYTTSILEIIREIDKHKKIFSNEYERDDTGRFTIATTHTQARYKLPKVVEAFVKKYPKVDFKYSSG